MMNPDTLVSCNHKTTKCREKEKGSWRVDCGVKVYDVEKHECKDCKHFFNRPCNYSGCGKHLMAVSPDMHVNYDIKEGTCWIEK